MFLVAVSSHGYAQFGTNNSLTRQTSVNNQKIELEFFFSTIGKCTLGTLLTRKSSGLNKLFTSRKYSGLADCSHDLHESFDCGQSLRSGSWSLGLQSFGSSHSGFMNSLLCDLTTTKLSVKNTERKTIK